MSHDYNKNLLEETVDMLMRHELVPGDVQYVSGDDFWFTWDDFAEVANVTYDAGHGGQEVGKDIRIVGEDWFLSRGEYDGSEWWEMNRHPTKPPLYKKPHAVVGGIWSTLAHIDKGGKYI